MSSRIGTGGFKMKAFLASSYMVYISSKSQSVLAFAPAATTSTNIKPILPSFLPRPSHHNGNAWIPYSRQCENRLEGVKLEMTAASEEAEKKDAEAARLRSMAAKLRAEAANLEAEKAKALAEAAEHAFQSFDINKDGVVSAEELKIGLEQKFKLELSDERVNDLMQHFDASGDGVLQKEEFVTVDKFKAKLESLVREEKDLARKAELEAKAEADAAALAQAKLELLNDKPPTTTDKIVSILPYLFPLLDGLQYSRFLLNEDAGSNPLVAIVVLLYAFYRTIPFAGLAAFFALNFLSFNLQLNRLVRFNLQQAIFVDIALIIPGLIFGITTAALPALGVEVPIAFTELWTDATFIILLALLGYSVGSSLLGITPDKIPLISDTVNRRMPTLDMFDDDGQFVGRPEDDTQQKKDDGDKKDK